MEEKKITTIKGFDSELKCRGVQYEVGKTHTIDGGIKLCGNGFHAIREDVNPLSVFNFYPPSIDGRPSRYCVVECGGEIERDEIKLCCSQIKIIKEISIEELNLKAQEWVSSLCVNAENGGDGSSPRGGYGSSLSGGDGSSLRGGYGSSLRGGDGSSLRGGYRSSLRGGYRSSLRGGDESSLRGGYGSSLRGGDGSSLRGGDGSSLRGGDGSSLRGGDRSSLSGGDGSSLRGGDGSSLRGGDGSSLRGGYGSSLRGGDGSSLRGGDVSSLSGGYGSSLSGGYGSKFRGGKWAVFAVKVFENGKFTGMATTVVDGEKIKADTWYKYKSGEWVECKGDEIPNDEIFN